MTAFEDIRPYNDDEVNAVLLSLLKDNTFISAIAEYRMPKLAKINAKTANRIVKAQLKKKFKNLKSVEDVQVISSTFVKTIVEKSTDGISVTGLAGLSNEKGYLFVSNHRDIAMDPALVGYLLYQSKLRTVEIAIGDNLLKKEYVGKLMRLNKSFIVKRSSKGREKLLASKTLSQYIHHAIEKGHNVWIAQREGRAKNGIDKTDAALIKMFHLAKRSTDSSKTLGDLIDNLNIIPISISYELDPCDEMKAQELWEVENNGFFEKDESSDVRSIGAGIKGAKGRIHVAFGKRIDTKGLDSDEIALKIDEQIISNYKLFPPNLLAYEKLLSQKEIDGPQLSSLPFDLKEMELRRTLFEQRLELVDKRHQTIYLKAYANPVLSFLQIQEKIAAK